MKTRTELYKEYRSEIVKSNDINLLRNRVLKSREIEEKKVSKKKEEKDETVYSFYAKRRKISIILYTFISIAILVIIAVGIYLGVRYING